jgi:peptide/nickel transport system permease protein
MAGFLLRRLAGRVVLAVAGASLAYLLAAAALDPRAAIEEQIPRPPGPAVDARLAQLGLDPRKPLPEQYLTWAYAALRGDLGRSLDGAPVAGELRRRAGVSMRLLTGGALLGTLGGVLAGTVGAVWHHRFADRLLTAATVVVLSVPVLALAVVVQVAAQWANDRSGLHVFAWTGEYADHPGDGRLRHLLLPTLTIAAGQLALCARYQRGALLDVMDAAFVRAAMARGLRRRRALLRHALPVAAVPMATFATYGFAMLLTGAAITEKIFAWHGMGEWLIDSIRRDDVNAVAACGCAAAVAVAAAGLLSDLTRAVLDPRVRP